MSVKHISIDLTKMFSGTLEKDLNENEAICPICKGLGVVKRNNVFGIDGDTLKDAKNKLFPYNNQSLAFCPNCYNGVVRLCKFCGKQIERSYIDKCDCEEYKKHIAAKRKLKYQKTINGARKINWNLVSEYVYDEKSDRFFANEDEFVDYYWDLYQQGKQCCHNFDEYFENEVPKVLWCCEKSKIEIDATSIVETACEELHEDAYENIDDIDELQRYLDMWCDKQSGTTTFYPCHKMYVEVTKDLFNQEG